MKFILNILNGGEHKDAVYDTFLISYFNLKIIKTRKSD